VLPQLLSSTGQWNTPEPYLFNHVATAISMRFVLKLQPASVSLIAGRCLQTYGGFGSNASISPRPWHVRFPLDSDD
jgi:hypothetical protein